MLAAHRDQENVVHNHQVPGKQQQMKTPGTRYPKTPSRFGHDENAPTALPGKTGLGGADNTIIKAGGMQQALVTPMGQTRSRAPLGNKTTNAKARAGNTGAGKGDAEKTQLKPTTRQKPSQKSSEIAPIKFDAKTAQPEIEDVDDEPEYAPPKPNDLPYESDVFPRGMLTFEGLKNENLFKGYYEHFHNPVDENGISKQEKDLEETMNKVMIKAEAQNQQETDGLKWNFADLADIVKPIPSQSSQVRSKAINTKSLTRRPASTKSASTITSRRAGSSFANSSDIAKKSLPRPGLHTVKSRQTLTPLLQGKRVAKEAILRKTSRQSNATGQIASRSINGYNKGRTNFSRVRSNTVRPDKISRDEKPGNLAAPKTPQPDLTVIPDRLGKAAMEKDEVKSGPELLSLVDEDDEGLPAMMGPLDLSDDEEEFELKFDI